MTGIFARRPARKKADLLTPESISPHIRSFVEKEVVYAEV
jgi:predicted nucleotidyltransferase